MKKQDLPSLSGRQAEIMQLAWDRGRITVAEVWQVLRKRRPIARNTVQTTIARLVDKGWLTARPPDPPARGFVYRPAQARQATGRRALRKLLDTVFAGSTDRLVATLLHDRGIDEAEARRIVAMIERAESNRPAAKGDRR
jgi:predicted transcriptional regulator